MKLIHASHAHAETDTHWTPEIVALDIFGREIREAAQKGFYEVSVKYDGDIRMHKESVKEGVIKVLRRKKYTILGDSEGIMTISWAKL